MHVLIEVALERHQRLSDACAWLAFEGRHFTEDELRSLFRELLHGWKAKFNMERTL